MDNKDKPAFPLRGKDGLLFDNNDSGLIPHLMIGLNKRELFTFGAMVGLLSNPVYHNPNEKHKMITVEALSKTALGYADATLNELAKDSNNPVK